MADFCNQCVRDMNRHHYVSFYMELYKEKPEEVTKEINDVLTKSGIEFDENLSLEEKLNKIVDDIKSSDMDFVREAHKKNGKELKPGEGYSVICERCGPAGKFSTLVDGDGYCISLDCKDHSEENKRKAEENDR